MTKYVRMLVVLSLVMAPPLSAQEKLSSGSPTQSYGPGWTFTPTFGVSETYDDNVSLFGRNFFEERNDDLVTTYFPAADLHYSGKHTRFDTSYSGSFLSYRTFSDLNRWDQRGKVELGRQETAHFKWFSRVNAAVMPSTDLVELGGIPYRHTGARTFDARGGGDFVTGPHDNISSTFNYQIVDFDRPAGDVATYLRGGHVAESITTWRHGLDKHLAVGTDYSFRRARVVGDAESFTIHTVAGAVDYELSPTWSFSGGGGIVYLQSTSFTDARTGPAVRLALDRHRGTSAFHVGYLRSYIPSFGFGGTIQNEEVGAGYRTALFGSRHWYFDNSAVFRNDTPLAGTFQQLPLRSLRTYSIVGWEPGRWVRIEGFYAHLQQTSLRAGGQLSRNRVGFQIVTSKPVRVQ
jgi:hypothetical protein